MAPEVFSAEQVAARLGLHVRTVRGYVRDGRLKAVRIGRRYRIAAADLELFTGLPAVAPPERTAEFAGVAELTGLDRQAADRIAAVAAASAGALRVEPVYDAERGSLKIIVCGELAASAELLRRVSAFAETLP